MFYWPPPPPSQLHCEHHDCQFFLLRLLHKPQNFLAEMLTFRDFVEKNSSPSADPQSGMLMISSVRSLFHNQIIQTPINYRDSSTMNDDKRFVTRDDILCKERRSFFPVHFHLLLKHWPTHRDTAIVCRIHIIADEPINFDLQLFPVAISCAVHAVPELPTLFLQYPAIFR